MVWSEVTDPVEVAASRVRHEQFDRNLAWFETQAEGVYRLHRGKCLCVAGQELFVADTIEDALKQARSSHPEDKGFFTRYIPKSKSPRIYVA